MAGKIRDGIENKEFFDGERVQESTALCKPPGNSFIFDNEFIWDEDPCGSSLNSDDKCVLYEEPCKPCDSSLLSYVTEEDDEVPCRFVYIYNPKDIQVAIYAYNTQEVISLLKKIDIYSIDLDALYKCAVDQRGELLGELLQEKQNGSKYGQLQSIQGIITLIHDLLIEKNRIDQSKNSAYVCDNIDEKDWSPFSFDADKEEKYMSSANESMSNIHKEIIENNKENDLISTKHDNMGSYTYHFSHVSISNSNTMDSKNSEYMLAAACCATILLTLSSFHVTMFLIISASALIVGTSIFMLNNSKNETVSTEFSHVQQPINIKSVSNSVGVIAH